jgi:hypothetical protein
VADELDPLLRAERALGAQAERLPARVLDLEPDVP